MRFMLLVAAVICFSGFDRSTTTQPNGQSANLGSIILSTQPNGQSANLGSIILSTYGTEFGLQTRIEAKLIEKADSVEINMTNIQMRLSKSCPYKGPRQLVAIKAGLAIGTQGGEWRFETVSEPQKFDVTIMPGVEHSIGEASFSAPKSANGKLSDYWIVVQVEEETPPGSKTRGASFIHSCRDVFQALEKFAMRSEKRPDCQH